MKEVKEFLVITVIVIVLLWLIISFSYLYTLIF